MVGPVSLENPTYGSKVYPTINKCPGTLISVGHRSLLHWHFLSGRKFLVRTDHGAVSNLLIFKDPQGLMATWLQVLDMYDLDIEHHLGRKHNNSDALSRGPCKHCRDEEHCVCVMMRGQALKEVQHPVSEDGGDWKLAVDVK